MFNWIRRQFKRVEVKPMPLTFELDRTASQQHIVRVYKQINDKHALVDDIAALWQYGYREEHPDDSGNITLYVLEEKDRQTLLALRSLNPDMSNRGELVFDFVPPMLNYFRRKENIEESEASSRLRIQDQPINPTLRVDYRPGEGLDLSVGYSAPDDNALLPLDELPATADGDYFIVGDTFIPKKQPSSARAKELLARTHHHIPLKDIPEFFLRDLVVLRRDFSAVLTDLANEIIIVDEPMKPLVRIHKDDTGWLDFYVGYESGGVSLPHGLLPARTDTGFYQVDDTTWIKLDSQVLRKTEQELEKLGPLATETGYRLPAAQFASLEEFIEQIGGRKEAGRAYQEFIAQLTGFQANERFALAPFAEARLRDQGIQLRAYQRAGVHWLTWLYQNHLHGILADDMGLGKTIQAILALREAYETSNSRLPSLIVSPRSVMTHWERELERFFPEAPTYRYHGANRQRRPLQLDAPIIFISTYATVTHDLRELITVPFFYVILDEATRIKNPGAKRSEAVKGLNSAHRLALSGTPVENRPAELWSLFDFLMRGHLGNYGSFVRLFENPILAGDRAMSERLGRRVSPFLLRRTKSEVAQDLPEKIEVDEWCRLTDEQRHLYGGLQGEMKRLVQALQRGEQVNYATSILPVLTKLKQICDHPALVTHEKIPLYGRSEKFDWIAEKLREILNQGEQVVLFSHFLGMLDLLEEWCRQKNYTYIRLDGSTGNRQAHIDRFNDRQAKVALLSIMAAGHGINLTAANHVIHADRWWNPAIEDQATDRVHRIGQDRTVYVYRILVEGTLEERIDRLLTTKRGLADQIVGAATKRARTWTRQELVELLRPPEE